MYAVCSNTLTETFKSFSYEPSDKIESTVPKKCKFCSFEAISNLFFLRHVCTQKLHDPLLTKVAKGWFKCEHCSHQTRRRTDMRRHIALKHQLSKKDKHWYKCDQCDYTCDRLFVFNQHIFRQHSDKDSIEWIQCESCDYKTKIRQNYQNHKRRQHLNTKVNCNYCNLQLSATYLKSHIAGVHTDKVEEHNCKFCEKTFKWKCSMLKHVRREHSGRVDWKKCPHCDYKNKEKSGLRIHIVTKHKQDEGEWYRCVLCNYKSLRAIDFKKHIVRKHTEDQDIAWFRCVYCVYKSKTRSDMVTHIQNKHTAPKSSPSFLKAQKYYCEFCQRSFAWKATLQKHVEREHTPEEKIKWIKCQDCSYKTPTRQLLKYHILKHHKQCEEWHHCSFCDYKSVYLSVIKLHIKRKHTKDEDISWFECDTCVFKTKTKHALVLHIKKMHPAIYGIGEIWFNCSECEAKFKRKADLTTHVFTVHKPDECEKIVKCFYCEFRHIHKSRVERHMSSKHKGQIKSE